jgi:hypothetical protein
MFWRNRLSRPEPPEPITRITEVAPPLATRDGAPIPIVRFGDDDAIGYSVTSPDEASRAVKQLRRRKQEIARARRHVQHTITTINAERRHELANQGRKVRGAGSVARTVRRMQTAARGYTKARYQERLDPYQQQKVELGQVTSNIERAIAHLKNQILRQGG